MIEPGTRGLAVHIAVTLWRSGLVDFKPKAGDGIGLQKSNAPMRALPRKSRHRRNSRSAELGDRALDVGDARRYMV